MNAYAFTHAAKEGARTGRGHTAVVRFDDLTLICTWTTWGAADALDPDGADQQRLAADAAAFQGLLAGMQVAVRW